MPKFNPITIQRHRGFTPKWHENDYPSYGSLGQASDMADCDLRDPNVLKPGPEIADLTNGNQSGAVDTLIRSILKSVVSSDVSYAIGRHKLYKISSTSVSNAGIWPHSITKSGEVGIDGEDVCHYQGKLLYSYNYESGNGDIGMYDLDSTFDDDYWTAELSGTELEDAPHQMINGGDDIVYIANGRYIASLDATTDNDQALDFWQDSVVSSITWDANRVLSAVNRPNVSGANYNQSAVYRWDTISDSWEGDPAETGGRIGALYTKNGTTYIWYESLVSGEVKLFFGIVSGYNIIPLRSFSGSLPLYYQVGEIGDYLIWLSDTDVYCYGPISGEIPVDLFILSSAKYSSLIGGIAAPFGKIIVSSYNPTS